MSNKWPKGGRGIIGGMEYVIVYSAKNRSDAIPITRMSCLAREVQVIRVALDTHQSNITLQ